MLDFLERILILISVAGGGGSSSGGGGGGSSSGGSEFSSSSSSHSSGGSGSGGFLDLLGIIIIFGVFGIITCVIFYRASKRIIQKPKENLTDDEAVAQRLFLRYQKDWSNCDTEAMRSYMTEKYHHRAELMIRALRLQERQNVVEDPRASYINTVSSSEHDLVITFRDASAMDKLVDVRTGKNLNARDVIFTETWSFVKGDNGEWLLDGTEPGTVRHDMVRSQMVEFAGRHELEYFADWGTLTLPTRGRIFNKGSFVNSDINNYMIGEVAGQLIQMYSYTPNVNVQVNDKPYPIYLVGQIAVPNKNYGGIILMRNKLIDRKPRGYKKYEFEWADFNKKYDVFATDVDKVTSFELLQPAFMEYLHDRVNIDFVLEVVDNVIYFYAKIGTDVKNYEVLLEVLLRAYKELKM